MTHRGTERMDWTERILERMAKLSAMRTSLFLLCHDGNCNQWTIGSRSDGAMECTGHRQLFLPSHIVRRRQCVWPDVGQFGGRSRHGPICRPAGNDRGRSAQHAVARLRYVHPNCSGLAGEPLRGQLRQSDSETLRLRRYRADPLRAQSTRSRRNSQPGRFWQHRLASRNVWRGDAGRIHRL